MHLTVVRTNHKIDGNDNWVYILALMIETVFRDDRPRPSQMLLADTYDDRKVRIA
jgi:hypothetical protein